MEAGRVAWITRLLPSPSSPSREIGRLDPVPSSAVNDCVPFSRSCVLSVPAFSPKINTVIVMVT